MCPWSGGRGGVYTGAVPRGLCGTVPGWTSKPTPDPLSRLEPPTHGPGCTDLHPRSVSCGWSPSLCVHSGGKRRHLLIQLATVYPPFPYARHCVSLKNWTWFTLASIRLPKKENHPQINSGVKNVTLRKGKGHLLTFWITQVWEENMDRFPEGWPAAAPTVSAEGPWPISGLREPWPCSTPCPWGSRKGTFGKAVPIHGATTAGRTRSCHPDVGGCGGFPLQVPEHPSPISPERLLSWSTEKHGTLKDGSED